jgi:hypothetical protein
LINTDGKATTQVLESIEKKTFISLKRFNNGITSKLACYKILIKSSIRFGTFNCKLIQVIYSKIV